MVLDGVSTKCGMCNQPIIWRVAKKTGKRVPLEPKVRQILDEEGNVVRGNETHFAYCKYADSYRRDSS